MVELTLFLSPSLSPSPSPSPSIPIPVPIPNPNRWNAVLGGVRWNAVADSLEATGGATAGGEAVLDRAEYVAISRLLFKALMPIWDAAAAQRSAAG